MGAADGGSARGMSPIGRAEADELLSREAMLLDTGDWDGGSSSTPRTPSSGCRPGATRPLRPKTRTANCRSSTIRAGSNLADRVWRARSGLSVASAPRPRVVHSVTNVLVQAADEAEAALSASFAVHHTTCAPSGPTSSSGATSTGCAARRTAGASPPRRSCCSTTSSRRSWISIRSEGGSCRSRQGRGACLDRSAARV